MTSEPTRILVVDDEEAILETMAFTFEDDYEVLTAASAREGLALLDEHDPVAAVITDQRMPEMTGVEFLSHVVERHPHTVRIILTGFADIDAIIDAINGGHVYAYITKPWEPEHLKQVVRRAVEHYELTRENERLLSDLQDANVFLEAVMDHLDTGALALDAGGVVRAANRPVRDYLGLDQDPCGKALKEVLEEPGLVEAVGGMALQLSADVETTDRDLDLETGGRTLRLRIRVQTLGDAGGSEIGRVIFLREISHEPLRRRFDDVLGSLLSADESLHPRIETAEPALRALQQEARTTSIDSPSMVALIERISRVLTALDHWMAVDDLLASEEFPDAQLLRERMRVAQTRWPLGDRVPERVRELARRVEAYYESGENPRKRTL